MSNTPLQAEPTGDGPLRTFVGLFFVPLVVVLLCVAVFIGFGWIAYDHQTTSDLPERLEIGLASPTGPGRLCSSPRF